MATTRDAKSQPRIELGIKLKILGREPGTTIFIDGEEHLGLIFYGLWVGGHPSHANAIAFAEEYSDGFKTYRLQGDEDEWVVCEIDCAADSLIRYFRLLKRCELFLDGFLGSGAILAWVGCEGLVFYDPPELFGQAMQSDVIAAKIKNRKMMIPKCAEGASRDYYQIPVISSSEVSLLHQEMMRMLPADFISGYRAEGS